MVLKKLIDKSNKTNKKTLILISFAKIAAKKKTVTVKT